MRSLYPLRKQPELSPASCIHFSREREWTKTVAQALCSPLKSSCLTELQTFWNGSACSASVIGLVKGTAHKTFISVLDDSPCSWEFICGRFWSFPSWVNDSCLSSYYMKIMRYQYLLHYLMPLADDEKNCQVPFLLCNHCLKMIKIQIIEQIALIFQI